MRKTIAITFLIKSNLLNTKIHPQIIYRKETGKLFFGKKPKCQEMKGNRRNKYSKIQNWNIFLSIGTLVIVGIMFFISNAYEPSWVFNWKEIRPEIRDTVKLIERYGSVTSGVVGINAKTPQQWYRRMWLMKNANEAELKQLLDYPSGAIKITAYEGLMRKRNINKYELTTQALNDTTTFFNYRSGCVGFPKMVGEYLIENVLAISERMPPLPPDRIKEYSLTEEQILTLRKLYNQQIDKKEWYLRNVYQ